MLKFTYIYINTLKPLQGFEVKAEGHSREELTRSLIKSRNAIALYYFLKYFPNLPEDLEELIRKKIKKIAKVDDIEKMKFPERNHLQTYESVSIVCETVNSFLSF